MDEPNFGVTSHLQSLGKPTSYSLTVIRNLSAHSAHAPFHRRMYRFLGKIVVPPPPVVILAAVLDVRSSSILLGLASVVVVVIVTCTWRQSVLALPWRVRIVYPGACSIATMQDEDCDPLSQTSRTSTIKVTQCRMKLQGKVPNWSVVRHEEQQERCKLNVSKCSTVYVLSFVFKLETSCRTFSVVCNSLQRIRSYTPLPATSGCCPGETGSNYKRHRQGDAFPSSSTCSGFQCDHCLCCWQVLGAQIDGAIVM